MSWATCRRSSSACHGDRPGWPRAGAPVGPLPAVLRRCRSQVPAGLVQLPAPRRSTARPAGRPPRRGRGQHRPAGQIQARRDQVVVDLRVGAPRTQAVRVLRPTPTAGRARRAPGAGGERGAPARCPARPGSSPRSAPGRRAAASSHPPRPCRSPAGASPARRTARWPGRGSGTRPTAGPRRPGPGRHRCPGASSGSRPASRSTGANSADLGGQRRPVGAAPGQRAGGHRGHVGRRFRGLAEHLPARHPALRRRVGGDHRGHRGHRRVGPVAPARAAGTRPGRPAPPPGRADPSRPARPGTPPRRRRPPRRGPAPPAPPRAEPAAPRPPTAGPPSPRSAGSASRARPRRVGRRGAGQRGPGVQERRRPGRGPGPAPRLPAVRQLGTPAPPSRRPARRPPRAGRFPGQVAQPVGQRRGQVHRRRPARAGWPRRPPRPRRAGPGRRRPVPVRPAAAPPAPRAGRWTVRPGTAGRGRPREAARPARRGEPDPVAHHDRQPGEVGRLADRGDHGLARPAEASAIARMTDVLPVPGAPHSSTGNPRRHRHPECLDRRAVRRAPCPGEPPACPQPPALPVLFNRHVMHNSVRRYCGLVLHRPLVQTLRARTRSPVGITCLGGAG